MHWFNNLRVFFGKRGKKLDVPPTDYVDMLTRVNVNENAYTQTSVGANSRTSQGWKFRPELDTDAFTVRKSLCKTNWGSRWKSHRGEVAIVLNASQIPTAK
jgi:hypothetical protein